MATFRVRAEQKTREIVALVQAGQAAQVTFDGGEQYIILNAGMIPNTPSLLFIEVVGDGPAGFEQKVYEYAGRQKYADQSLGAWQFNSVDDE
jgi:hypothetical protein